MSKIDSPRSKFRGIIDTVKDFYIYLLANPAAKLRGTEFTSSAKLMRSPGFNLSISITPINVLSLMKYLSEYTEETLKYPSTFWAGSSRQ